MATTIARLVLVRRHQRRPSVLFSSPPSRSLHHLPKRNNGSYSRYQTSLLFHNHKNKRITVLQKRHYLFFPSDWSELRYRWKLFWENKTPTKVKLRWQERKTKLLDRRSQYVQATKSQVEATKTQVSANYQFQKMRFQKGYNQQREKYQQRRSELNQVKGELQQRSREFTKRWKARQRDMVQDSSDMFKGYLARRSKVFTVEEYAQPHWFDSKDGRPLTSRDPTGRFVNPWLSWSSNGVHSITNVLKWRYQRFVRQWQIRGWKSLLPKDLSQMVFGPAVHAASKKKTKKPITNDNYQQTSQPTEIDFTWIGHSTCLVRMGNATILTDPIFSHRCTPFQRMPGVGVARETPPSINLDDLPEIIDVCLISHDHYDHLDHLSVLALRDRVQHWVLPTGLPEWLESRCSVDPAKMIELEWWESVKLKFDPAEHQWRVVNNYATSEEHTMTITCCPAQHWSSRTFFDRCKRLWCGFAVETQTNTSEFSTPVVQKFFFAGDTGMPRNDFPLFSLIGDFCGRGRYHPENDATLITETSDEESALPVFHPFDLAAIPIGAYEPAFLMQEAHMNPEEAVQCAQQLQARKSVAIHFGTFELSEEPLREPPQRLKEALDSLENENVDFVALPIGGSLRVPANHAEVEGEIVENPGTEAANLV